jgi:hypothetical protein
MSVRYLLGIVMLLSSVGRSVAEEKEPLPLLVTKIKVGQDYATDGGGANTWGKIVQVIDDNNMLIGIDNGGNPRDRYSVIVLCKFPTKGLTDGQTGFLAKFLGTSHVTVSGTTRYKTVDGGTRTVFVLEPASARPQAKADPIADAKMTIDQIRKVIQQAEDSLRKAKTAKERENYENALKQYRKILADSEQQLAALEKAKAEENLTPDELAALRRKEAEEAKQSAAKASAAADAKATEKHRNQAAFLMRSAKAFIADAKEGEAKEYLEKIIATYGDTPSADEARALWEKLTGKKHPEADKKKPSVQPDGRKNDAGQHDKSVPPAAKEPAKPVQPSQNASPRETYLVDLQAEKISAVVFKKDQQVKVKGVESTKSLFLHPPGKGFSEATYSLDGKYRQFKASVAINDGANGGAGSVTPLTFSVYLDGKEVWKSNPVQKCGQTQECDVGVTGAGKIALRVTCPAMRPVPMPFGWNRDLKSDLHTCGKFSFPRRSWTAVVRVGT